MSPRRTLTAAVLSLSLLTFAACGDDDETASGQGLDAVAIEAEPGKAPEVDFEKKLDPDKIETEVLVEGDGEKTKIGDMVTAYIWIGNGFDKKEVLNTYEAGEPEQLELVEELLPGLQKGLVGQKVGSVVAVAAPAKDAFGEGGRPDMGIGDGDSVLFVTEIVSKLSEKEAEKAKAEQEKAAKEAEKAQKQAEKKAAATQKKVDAAKKKAPKEATGKKVKPAAWAPKVTYKKGQVPVFDFSGTPKPTGKLQVTQLIKGNGPKVKAGQTLIVHYVGQVFGAKEPFDSSYSRNDVATFPIGVGQVVQGWDQSLVGQKVGSRVIVQIPPELGYGEQGNPDAGIKGDDTIVFAVDILGAV